MEHGHTTVHQPGSFPQLKGGMWICDFVLNELGFRCLAERFWICERGFDCAVHEHLSIYPWSEHTAPGGARLIELDTFHVTITLEAERLHFYYHERSTNVWEPGGHTSSAEIRRIGHNPERLRRRADAIAAALVAALQGALLPRRLRRRQGG